MDTRRPTVPAAEEILGGYFPVLDHGFVALVDYMGTDADVERAARVSYGYGTRKVSRTRGLIRYLRRHRHTTPFEMVELKFHCAMPMFVARQWIRHRTACLAGDTEVSFDLPGAVNRSDKRLYKLTIRDIWERFQPTNNRTRPDKQRNPYYKRDRVRQMLLRQMNEDTGEIEHTHVKDVYRNGVKPVFRMRLADGKTVDCTADHKFLFEDGWATLKNALGLDVRRGMPVWKKGEFLVHVNGSEVELPAYQNAEWLSRQYVILERPIQEIAEDCGVTYHTVRKWLTKHELTEPGRGRFSDGQNPWNKGQTYSLGPRESTETWVEANRGARAGAASNFWKGGKSDDRSAIGRWTTQIAAKIHRRNGWTCQLCKERAGELHCHHIVPVWADESRARDETNLTTLCGDCHRNMHGNELDYVERLGGPPVKADWVKRPRVPWNKLSVARLVRVVGFDYLGERETYDIEVEGPQHNFIANGIVTHNSVNEYSGRYSLMPLLYYRPEREHFALQSAANRQGREAGAADEELYHNAVERWNRTRAAAGEDYAWMVGHDVAREIARIDLPLSTYTQWYWKIDLHNLFHFLALRVDPHAQYEIRAYAEVMAGMLERVAPLAFEAWADYELGGAHVSRGEREALSRLVEATDEELRPRPGADPLDKETLKDCGLSPREARELLAKMRAPERTDFTLDLSAMRAAEELAGEMQDAVPEVDGPGPDPHPRG